MPVGKATRASLAESLAAGTKKHLGAASSLAFGGGALTPAEVEAFLQRLADLRAAVESGKAEAAARIAEERAQAPALHGQMKAYVSFVRARFGDQPDVLADFGLEPRKARTPLTIDEQAAAVAKRKATRQARHTMGKKQKKKVKGDVVGVSVIPVTTPHAAT
ncbi:MAG: hypothetical protein ACRENE_25465 [Polyangiaceae bacterium]